MRSMAKYFTSFPGKKDSFFYKLRQAGVTDRKYASYPVFFHRLFKHLFKKNVSGMLLYVTFFHVFDTN